MLKRLGKELGVGLAKRRVDYYGALMEIDGVDENHTVFVEAYARIGHLKTGQEKKVATDALKLAALTEQYPDAQMILAFADQAAADSVVGWLRAVLEQRGIKRVVVTIATPLKAKLLVAQADQKTGMETG